MLVMFSPQVGRHYRHRAVHVGQGALQAGGLVWLDLDQLVDRAEVRGGTLLVWRDSPYWQRTLLPLLSGAPGLGEDQHHEDQAHLHYQHRSRSVLIHF